MTAIKALIRELEKAFVIVQQRDVLAPADEVCVVGEFEEAAFTADTAVLDGTTASGDA
jgi:ATP-dependent protease HslVU (ClpYQ) peptidase subunit